jgi:hypothetical protein
MLATDPCCIGVLLQTRLPRDFDAAAAGNGCHLRLTGNTIDSSCLLLFAYVCNQNRISQHFSQNQVPFQTPPLT